ncbi:adenosine receptor A3-like [Nematostella vectensis]|uniref:adenosine receptor A3-like n=1 Tax=Nematostella vectensis TaxID=45351 RepID=UPI0020779144|nr:adenosine receptor A3-like [Nematostella vectensis]
MANFSFPCFKFSNWVRLGQITGPQFTVVTVLNGITFLPAIVLNVLVLVSIWRTSALHTPAMVFLGNLALSDLMVGSLAQPVFVTCLALELDVMRWEKMYCWVAITAGFLTIVMCFVTLFNITAVASERYLALYLHFRYCSIITMRWAILSCSLLWMMALLLGVLWATGGMELNSSLICVLVAVCIGIIILCYTQVYRALRKHQLQIQALNRPSTASSGNSLSHNVHEFKRYRKSGITSLYVYLLFLLCYIPPVCVYIYHEVTRDAIRLPNLLKIAISVIFINSAINPMIYCCKLKAIRNSVWPSLTTLFLSLRSAVTSS